MNHFLQTTVFGVAADDGGAFDAEEAKNVELRNKWCGILHPDTRVRGFYDFLQLLILLYLAWVLPNRLAFSKTPIGWEVMGDMCIDVW